MRILVLGPVEVLADDRAVQLSGAKPKALLAALVLQPRQVVSIEQLVSLVWDDAPPRSATALIHTYVAVLRRVFASAGWQSMLLTRAPGYLLDLARADSDLEAFQQHFDLARRAEHGGDLIEAAARYQQALELWRGPAFGGVDTDFARRKAEALEQDLLTIQLGLARGELADSRPWDSAARMAKVTARYPLREDARGLLMRALFDSGRQAEALAVYQDARHHLREELGLEPGEQLRTLHSQILRGTPGPAAATRATSSAAVMTQRPIPKGQHTIPRHLPPDISDFTGRTQQLDSLRRLAEDTAGPRTATPLVVVSGFGGAGKSALAVHAAHLLRKRYPDGQLFADLRVADPQLGVRDALGRFLGALGVPGTELPDTEQDRVELYRRKVADRAMVVVLDNVSGERQVRNLVPGSPDCLVIITSRSRLTGLEGADLIELDFFSVEASVQMLATIVGSDRVAADPRSAATIARLCGGIPLAIRAAAAKLLARPHWPLRALAERLHDERRRLDELTVGDLAIRSSLQLNYAELDDLHRRAFHLLALLDLPDFGSWLAAPLLDVPLHDAEDVVEHLVDLRLLEVVGIDGIGRVRYRFHDLVQLFGAEQAAGEPVAAAINRLLVRWTSLVEAGGRLLPRATIGLRYPAVGSADLDSRLLAEVEGNPLGWLKSETAAVVRTVERTHELGVDGMATLLIASLLSAPFAARNEFDGWQRTLDVALAAARKSADRRAEAIILSGFGQLAYEKDDFRAALEHFTQARRHAEAVGDEHTQAIASVGIGTVHRDLGGFAAAAEHLNVGAEIAQRVDDLGVVAAARYGLSAISRDRGDLDSAVGFLDSCLELYRDLGDTRGEALSLRGLSLCHRAKDEPGRAAELSRQAWTILHNTDDPLGAAYALQSLAKAQIRHGPTTGVADLLTSCHLTFTRHHDRFGVALVTRTMGELALARGADDRARRLLTDALAQWIELGLPIWQARTLRDLAAADPAAATEHWARAIELFTAFQSRERAELAATTPKSWRDHVQNS